MFDEKKVLDLLSMYEETIKEMTDTMKEATETINSLTAELEPYRKAKNNIQKKTEEIFAKAVFKEVC